MLQKLHTALSLTPTLKKINKGAKCNKVSPRRLAVLYAVYEISKDGNPAAVSTVWNEVYKTYFTHPYDQTKAHLMALENMGY